MSTEVYNAAVDLAHLARYTGGDRALNGEVLRLFEDQAAQLLTQLEAILLQPDKKAWHDIHHSLKGAARGIGAFEMADAAARGEPMDPGADNKAAARALHDLKGRAQAVQFFIDAYLGRV